MLYVITVVFSSFFRILVLVAAAVNPKHMKNDSWEKGLNSCAFPIYGYELKIR